MTHRIVATLAPSGCDARNVIELDGKKILCREFNIRAAVGEVTQVSVELEAVHAELKLEVLDVRFIKSAPSYEEWAGNHG